MIFTKKELKQLKVAYSTVEKIDPLGEGYKNLTKLLDSLPLEALIQISNHKINFVSMLADNRIRRINGS